LRGFRTIVRWAVEFVAGLFDDPIGALAGSGVHTRVERVCATKAPRDDAHVFIDDIAIFIGGPSDDGTTGISIAGIFSANVQKSSAKHLIGDPSVVPFRLVTFLGGDVGDRDVLEDERAVELPTDIGVAESHNQKLIIFNRRNTVVKVDDQRNIFRVKEVGHGFVELADGEIKVEGVILEPIIENPGIAKASLGTLADGKSIVGSDEKLFLIKSVLTVCRPEDDIGSDESPGATDPCTK